MNMTSRIEALRQQHAALSEQVENAARHPATDTLELAQMKKQKLHLKEEISRLQGR